MVGLLYLADRVEFVSIAASGLFLRPSENQRVQPPGGPSPRGSGMDAPEEFLMTLYRAQFLLMRLMHRIFNNHRLRVDLRHRNKTSNSSPKAVTISNYYFGVNACQYERR